MDKKGRIIYMCKICSYSNSMYSCTYTYIYKYILVEVKQYIAACKTIEHTIGVFCRSSSYYHVNSLAVVLLISDQFNYGQHHFSLHYVQQQFRLNYGQQKFSLNYGQQKFSLNHGQQQFNLNYGQQQFSFILIHTTRDEKDKEVRVEGRWSAHSRLAM
jgi:hypothetical protein